MSRIDPISLAGGSPCKNFNDKITLICPPRLQCYFYHILISLGGTIVPPRISKINCMSKQ